MRLFNSRTKNPPYKKKLNSVERRLSKVQIRNLFEGKNKIAFSSKTVTRSKDRIVQGTRDKG